MSAFFRADSHDVNLSKKAGLEGDVKPMPMKPMAFASLIIFLVNSFNCYPSFFPFDKKREYLCRLIREDRAVIIPDVVFYVIPAKAGIQVIKRLRATGLRPSPE